MTAPKLWMVLARCHHTLALLVERDIAGLGLCLSDFMVLEALLHKGPLTISEIQAKVLLASGSDDRGGGSSGVARIGDSQSDSW